MQKVEKLLMLESSVNSILSTLKASIQALALTATTPANAVCLASEENKHGYTTFSSTFKASSIGREPSDAFRCVSQDNIEP